MESPDEKSRAKAVRVFAGRLKGRPFAKRRPDLIQPLTDLFYKTRDTNVRCVCVAALIELAEDGAAPTPLFDALLDPDPGLVLQGIWALPYFPDPRALEPLCKFIESRVNVFFNENAMWALGEIRDERAVPTLVSVLLDTHNRFDQSFGSAAMALARCGPPGFDVLVAALEHQDARVRHAAVVGLDTSGDPRAAAYLDRMETDPEPRVRERARIRMGNPWK